MIARVAALACMVALVAPAAAGAQDSPFTPIPQPVPDPVTQAPPPGEQDDGLSASQQLLIGLAALVLLLAIGWAIMRDARSAAPADRPGGPVTADGERLKGTRAPPRRRVQKGRQRAKAARQARKKNR